MTEVKYCHEAEKRKTDLPTYVLTVLTQGGNSPWSQVIPGILIQFKVALDVFRQKDPSLLQIICHNGACHKKQKDKIKTPND